MNGSLWLVCTYVCMHVSHMLINHAYCTHKCVLISTFCTCTSCMYHTHYTSYRIHESIHLSIYKYMNEMHVCMYGSSVYSFRVHMHSLMYPRGTYTYHMTYTRACIYVPLTCSLCYSPILTLPSAFTLNVCSITMEWDTLLFHAHSYACILYARMYLLVLECMHVHA